MTDETRPTPTPPIRALIDFAIEHANGNTAEARNLLVDALEELKREDTSAVLEQERTDGMNGRFGEHSLPELEGEALAFEELEIDAGIEALLSLVDEMEENGQEATEICARLRAQLKMNEERASTMLCGSDPRS